MSIYLKNVLKKCSLFVFVFCILFAIQGYGIEKISANPGDDQKIESKNSDKEGTEKPNEVSNTDNPQSQNNTKDTPNVANNADNKENKDVKSENEKNAEKSDVPEKSKDEQSESSTVVTSQKVEGPVTETETGIETPIFSFGSISGVISFSVLSLLLITIIILLIVCFIKLLRIDDDCYDISKESKGHYSDLKRNQEELRDRIDYLERSLDRFKKSSDDKFSGMDRNLSNLSNDMFRQRQESTTFKRQERNDSFSSRPLQNLTIKEKYNLYLNNQADLPKEFIGTECSFGEYGNQLERKSGGVFYALNCGNNKYEVYPSRNVIIDDRMRPRYLNVSFFEIARSQTNEIQPCILQESAFGKYDIISKGKVYYN